MIAALFSAAVILSAPFIGQVQAAIRSAFPARFDAIIGWIVAACVAAAIVLALVRIRDRRAARYSAIAAAVLLAAVYAAGTRTGNPDVDAVERFHFVEYGLVSALFYREWRRRPDLSGLVLPGLAGTLVGIVDEGVQWFVPVRIGEARDVFLNAWAVACGLLFAAGVEPPARLAPSLLPGSRVAIGALAGAVVLAFAVFFQAVHLGHEVRDPDIGSFRSRYRAERLERLALDRVERWRDAPPVIDRPLSREDQYHSEGIWHVRQRNDQWDGGDVAAAWRENLILERYYGPVLDLPASSSAGAGHRWAPQQRDDAETRGAGMPRPFVSQAVPYPMYTWPRSIYWSAVGVLLCGIALWSGVHRAPGRRPAMARR